jgi:hypothetical protein
MERAVSQIFIRSFVIVLLLGAGWLGCRQAKPDAEPAEAVAGDSRQHLDALMERLPADRTAVVAYVTEVGEVASSLDEIIELVGQTMPEEGRYERLRAGLLSQQLGFYPLDVDALEAAGIAADRPAIVGGVDERLVASFYVSDRDRFHDRVTESTGQDLREVRHAGRTLYASGHSALWGFEDDRVVMTAPAAATPGPAEETVVELLVAGGSNALVDTEAFADFQAAATDAPMGVYVPATGPNFADSVGALVPWELRSSGLVGESFEQGLVESLRGIGVTARVDADRLQLATWFGLTGQAMEAVQEWGASGEAVDWSAWLGADPVAFMSLHLDASAVWAGLGRALQPQAAQMLDGAVAGAFGEQPDDFDIEERLLSKLSGNAAIVLLRAADADASAARDPFSLDGQASAVAVLHFVDEQTPDRLAERFGEAAAEQGLRVHVRDKWLAIAGGSLAEDRIDALLEGASEAGPPSELAAGLSGPRAPSGGFVDVAALTALGDLTPLVGVDSAEELLVTVERVDGAVVARSEVRPGLYPGHLPYAYESFINRSKLSEARAVTQHIATSAKAYHMTRHEFVACSATADVSEPWYCASEFDAGHPGELVAAEDKVFPGGVDQRLTTAPQAPSAGQKVDWDPAADRFLDETVDALQLGGYEQPLYFQYTYETNGERGSKAEATVRAVHDFNPQTEQMHTIEIYIQVDPQTGAAVISPAVTIHDME